MALEDSGFGRLIGALVSPGRTFRSIAERPTWAVALVALLVVGTITGVLANKRIDPNDMRQTVEKRMEKQLGQRPTPDQVDSQMNIAKKVTAVFIWLAPVASVMFYLLLALLFWLAFRFVAGSELGYKTSFSVLLHAFMPWLVAGLLTLPVILSREHIGVQEAQQGLLASNLAAFAPESAGSALKSLLGSLDFFSLWTLVLLILGYRTAAKSSTGSAVAVILVVWLLYVGIKVGLGALFG
ncbi:MAG: hypothetical protein QOF89_2623 [Acidobacteriota bacterium]|jgi:hypothetical protein|nr:hypothetical protein [Acidobacteriota bacterium]